MSHKTNLERILGLNQPPVAIGFSDEPPNGIPKWNEGELPAGCGFWLKAMEGKTFYTVVADHYNCAIGCYTHKFDLPKERAHELNDTVGFMVAKNYILSEEVPGIPTMKKSYKVVTYGPVNQVSFRPDAVIVALKPAQAMLLYEAVLRAGVGNGLKQILGRPGCSVVPLTIDSQTVTLSFGCMGNRTFTGLPDDQLYVCIPGEKWEAVEQKLPEIHQANMEMKAHYEGSAPLT